MNFAIIKLVLLDSKNSLSRLLFVVFGTAFGLALVLTMLGAYNAVGLKNDRSAWYVNARGELFEAAESETQNIPVFDFDAKTVSLAKEGTFSAQEIAVTSLISDTFKEKLISRLNIFTFPDTKFNVPEIGAVPKLGEYFASHALQKLIEETPKEQLGDRYGKFVGFIDDSVLAGPDSLLAVVGVDETDISKFNRFYVMSEKSSNVAMDGAWFYKFFLLFGSIALIFPVLLFINIVTQLGAAQRRERFATLALIGAQAKVLARISGFETFFTSFLGALLGIILSFPLRAIFANISLGGTKFFVEDLSVSWQTTGIVLFVLVFCSTLVAMLKVYRSKTGSLGISKYKAEKTPKIWRLVPLTFGLLLMSLGTFVYKATGSDGFAYLQLLGFVFVLVGVVFYGPWATLKFSRLFLRFAKTAAGVVSGNRIRNNPVAIFRSVSGMVVAVFLASFFAGVISGVQGNSLGDNKANKLPAQSIILDFIPEAAEFAKVAKTPGVEAVNLVYGDDSNPIDDKRFVDRAGAAALGFAEIPAGNLFSFDFYAFIFNQEVKLEVAPLELEIGENLVPEMLVVGTDGKTETFEILKTAFSVSAAYITYLNQEGNSFMSELSALAYIGMIVAIVIAGCSLAVSTTVAMLERKRIFGLMRLMGMPISVLRKIVIIEALVPLVAVLVSSILLGFLSAWFILQILRSGGLNWPESEYFVSLAVSLVLVVAAVFASFGIARKNTEVTETRFE